MRRFGKLVFTPKVKAVQERMGSRRAYARADAAPDTPDSLGEDEAAFLAERDSFYVATVGESGWPYVQHRGGPKGFVRVLDPHTLGFADFQGNRQYVSVGNLAHDDRAALIFVDYPNQARLKVLARVSFVGPEAPEVLARLTPAGYPARVERGVLLHVEAFDWNCPQHITPRFTEDEIREQVAPVLERLGALEEENRKLREALGRSAADAASG